MCYDNCRYFRKDTETCRLGKGEACPNDQDNCPAWPPPSEEYGAYRRCDTCPCQDKDFGKCHLCDPKEQCENKDEIMTEVYGSGPYEV